MAVSWKGVVGTVAPALATALGGPLAGVAVRTIADKVLGKPEAGEADVAAAIESGASPDMLLKLKQADQDFAKAMADAGIELEKLEVEDRASARQREIAVKDWTPRALAITFTVAFFGILWYLLGHEIPTPNKEIILILLGALAGAVTTILTYYFGSSRSSQAKDAVLGRVATGGK